MRILIAEDIDLVAEAFEVLLGLEADLNVVARVGRGDEVVEAVERYRIDVALLDIDMPGCSGIEATAALRAAGSTCKVLLLTALPGSGHVPRALSAGANGYLAKTTSMTRLIEAIRAVAAGGTVVDPQLAAEALLAGGSPITEREAEALSYVADGASTNEIAEAMFLTKGTVRNYLSSAMSKLEANTRIEAAAKAHAQGWI